LEAQLAYSRARNPLLLDPDCPQVGTRAGQVSAKERDLWVNARIPDEFEALERKRLIRTNAVDYMWQVKKQSEIMQSINNNAKAIQGTYRGGGR
jgi:hypothetical protein